MCGKTAGKPGRRYEWWTTAKYLDHGISGSNRAAPPWTSFARSIMLVWSEMHTLPLRILGLLLLSVAIVIPSCQAVFPTGTVDTAPFRPGFVRD
jgi:hypothetical protein